MKRLAAVLVLNLFATVAVAGVVGTVAPPAKDDKKAMELKKEQLKDKADHKDKAASKHKADDKAKLKAPEKHAESKGNTPGK